MINTIRGLHLLCVQPVYILFLVKLQVPGIPVGICITGSVQSLSGIDMSYCINQALDAYGALLVDCFYTFKGSTTSHYDGFGRGNPPEAGLSSKN